MGVLDHQKGRHDFNESTPSHARLVPGPSPHGLFFVAMRVHTVSSHTASSALFSKTGEIVKVSLHSHFPRLSCKQQGDSREDRTSTDLAGSGVFDREAENTIRYWQDSAVVPILNVSKHGVSQMTQQHSSQSIRFPPASPVPQSPASASTASSETPYTASTPALQRKTQLPLLSTHSVFTASSSNSTAVAYATRDGLMRWTRVRSFCSSQCGRPKLQTGLVLALFVTLGLLWYGGPPELWTQTRIITLIIRRYARRALHAYQRLLHIYPLMSRSISAGFIFLTADSIAQILSRPRHKHLLSSFSLKRALRYSLYGLIIMGPLLYVWYNMMHKFGPPDDMQGAMLKSIFEEITLEPLCIFLYMVYDAVINKRTYRQFKHTFQTRFHTLWFINSLYWLPANFANYYVGTPDMRVLFANTCSLFWNVYFADKASKWSSSHRSLNNPSTAKGVEAKPLPV